MRFRQVHLDFHTSEKIPGIGSKFDKKQWQDALKAGHVDSITVFSKCHHGWAYHPSVKNEMHPNLDFDLLGAQIEASHEIGVKTPVYISAGLDEKYAVRHHEWLVRDENDKTTWAQDFLTAGYHKFCMNTPYLDYLLEQIREVCENYDADGIFLDIVGVQPCYCQNCLKTLDAEGKSRKNPEDVLALAERVYANYTKRVRETIDSVKPGLPVFHNGGHIRIGRRDIAFMNSHLEIESLPTGGWGYDHFPLSARYSQTLSVEYLGMTGKFHKTWGEFGGFKHPNALRYEAALSAANGAKCSIGDQLHPGGKMDMATYKLIGSAYSELEEKEEWLDNVTAVSDVGLFSIEAYNDTFGTGQSTISNEIDSGVCRMLLEGKYLFDVLDFESDFNKYKVVILPDAVKITARLKAKLDAFVKNGGKILATGESGLCSDKDEFAYDFGVKYIGKNPYKPDYFRPDFEIDGLFESSYIMYTDGERVVLANGKELGKREDPYFNRDVEHFCSHQHTPSSGNYGGPGMSQGKDGIYVAWKVFEDYATLGSLISKRIVTHALDVLLGENKTLKTNLGAQGIVTLMEQDGRYINHLLYAVPVRRGKDTEIIEDIYPVCNTEVELKLDKKIKKAYLAPQKKEIPFDLKNGKIKFKVDEFECHQMVVLEY